jgi:transposase
MENLTIREIADILNVSMPTAKQRIHRKGIVPVRYVGMIGLYDPTAVDAIRDVPGKGRPKKDNPETADKEGEAQ